MTVVDDLTPTQRFEGRVFLAGRQAPFAIDAAAYANDTQLRAAVYATAGPKVQIHCKMDELRNAIGCVSTPEESAVTTNFGWDASGTRFLVPTGVVTADGFRAHPVGGAPRVDLSGHPFARHLGFAPLQPGDLEGAQRHVVEDLLAVHDRRVTHSLLAMCALAVLYRHADGMGRFALWLKGLTGAGKSYTAKLFANFFGHFSVNPESFIGWGATPNFVQHQGYFFRDALYLVDDWKPEVTRSEQVVRVLQAYADNTARGRLNSRAEANPTRPIRGMLVSTAEDVPEHTSSTLGRMVVLTVPQQGKDLDRGRRCQRQLANYSGVMADFVRFALAGGWTVRFAGEVNALQQRLVAGVEGRQNDARMTGNLALLGTAFRAACEYLRDVWPGAPDAAARFAETDLTALRDEMLTGAREQQASEVFLHVLAGLIENCRVKIENWPRHADLPATVKAVGRMAPPSDEGTVFQLCTSLCLEEVNRSLSAQGRSIVAATEKALIDLLAGDGKLLPPLVPRRLGADRRDHRTEQMPVGGSNRRGFRIAAEVLLGE